MTTKRTIIRFKERPRLNVMELIGFCTGVAMLFAAAVLVLLALASCSIIDEDTSDCPPDSLKAPGRAIAFTVANGDSTARGTSTRTAQGTLTLDGTGGTESLREKGFGVFACHTGVHPYVSMSTTPDLMYNQRVAFDGLTSTWTYNPLVYWPNSDDGLDEYVTFFAYGPHSDEAPECIVDMSHPDELGDPWLTYQLGGSEDDWRTRQADLVYDFRKDLRRDRNVATNVQFTFRHALACAGDTVIVTCGPRLQRLLMKYAAAMGDDVTLTLRTLTLDYLLTRKGRLVLNSSTQPNWQAVESEDARVHRYVRLSPGHELATSTTTVCSVTDYSVGGKGVFYIPLETGDGGQQVTVTATYQLTNGDEGEVSTAVDLSRLSEPSLRNGLRISLELPEPECTGVALSRASLGMVICSHGRAHAATAGALSCEGSKVAMVAYVGDGDTGDSDYNHGLAIALEDAGQAVWCGQETEYCLDAHTNTVGEAVAERNGLSATAALVADEEGHGHEAAVLAADYRYVGSGGAGSHPQGTSRWFLPSLGQWYLMAQALTGHSSSLTSSENDDYKAAAFNPLITAAGGTGVHGEPDMLYWSSTESSKKNAWYMSFEKGKTQADGKTTVYCVRPILAY